MTPIKGYRIFWERLLSLKFEAIQRLSLREYQLPAQWGSRQGLQTFRESVAAVPERMGLNHHSVLGRAQRVKIPVVGQTWDTSGQELSI
jgi:hypothetical protein